MSEANNNIQAAIEAGRELATKPFDINGTPFLVLPNSHTFHELDGLREHPQHIKQTVNHTTAASFIAYCQKFARENSVILIDDINNKFTAIFDYHGPDTADWGQHKAVFAPKPTVEWSNWKSFDGKALSQSEFGKFIETNLEEIIEPSGAEMLEIALSIQAKNEVKFSQAQRLDNGQMQLTYNEEINGSAGVKGQLKIPQTFKIGLRLYEGGAPYQIEARLRYRIKEGNLALWYELIRPHKTVQANLMETEELISASVGSAIAIYHGTISQGQHMRDSLSQAIAKQLADSNVGLFRGQLVDRISGDMFKNDPDYISAALNVMLNDGHVEKSARQGMSGSRWSLTPKGRAAYLVLHDTDETDDATPVDELHGEDLSPEQVDQKLAELSKGAAAEEPITDDDCSNSAAPYPYTAEHMQQTDSAVLHFDTRETLDRALYGLVKLIRDAAEQPAASIERKPEKIALLERLENNDLFPGNVRALLSYIRRDIEQLDEA